MRPEAHTKEKKRVQKTVLYLVTSSGWGGAQRYVYDLACAARDAGYAAVAASGGDGLLAERLKKANVATVHIPSLGRDTRVFKDLRAFFGIRRVIRSVRPDIVHLNSSKAGGLGALAARICRVPCIIFTVHGLPQNEPRALLLRNIIALITWFTALLAHRVIAVARGDAERLRQELFLRKKISHIPNGIARTELDRDSARQRILARIADEKTRETLLNARWVGTIAELTHNKGHHYAFDAFPEVFHRHPDSVYIVIGDGELADTHKAHAARSGFADRICFAGFIPDADMLHAAFDIYLSTSVKEGLPYSIIEAMASGVPVVATAVGGIPDIVADGISGILVTPRLPSAVADALIRLLGDPDYRAALGERGRTQVTKTHTLSVMTTQTLALYARCG